MCSCEVYMVHHASSHSSVVAPGQPNVPTPYQPNHLSTANPCQPRQSSTTLLPSRSVSSAHSEALKTMVAGYEDDYVLLPSRSPSPFAPLTPVTLYVHV